MKFHHEKVYKDGHGNYHTDAQRKLKGVSTIIGGWGVVTENGDILDVYDRKYVAKSAADHYNRTEEEVYA